MASSAEAKPERIGQHLSFRPAFDSPVSADLRPMVIIYGWLVAKSRHIHKFGDYYLGQGFDVLHVKIKPGQLAWPVGGQKVVTQVMDFIADTPRSRQPLLLHGFSVGGHLIGETLVKIFDQPEKYEQVGLRLRGQIFDSPVDYEGVPYGMGKALTKVPILQKLITFSMQQYLTAFYKQTNYHFQRSSQSIHENRLKLPTLFLSSIVDPVSPKEPIDKLIEKWRESGVTEIYEKYWLDSPHVCHFLHHPVEYIEQLNMFLDKIGLTRQTEKAGAQQDSFA